MLHGKKPYNITTCFYIGTAYAASIGGCGALSGTSTNTAFVEAYQQFTGEKVDFAKFMYYNIPPMLINTFFTWLYLQWLFMGMFRPNSKEAEQCRLCEEGENIARGAIPSRYRELGPVSQQEVQVAMFYVIIIVVLFTIEWVPLHTWSSTSKISVAFVIVYALFVPINWSWLIPFNRKSLELPIKSTSNLITWNYVNQNFPWGLIFMLGGGLYWIATVAYAPAHEKVLS